MPSQASLITVPNVHLTMDDLLTVIRQLDERDRIRVAQVLVETQMDAKLANLIDQLAQMTPSNDISDSDIDSEVKAIQ